MSEEFNKITAVAVNSQAEATEALGKLLAVAQPQNVYSAPLQVGDYTIITASEVVAGIGFGYGFGGGSGPAPAPASKETHPTPAATAQPTGETPTKPSEAGGLGGGGGGGGTSSARPVAVIKLSKDGKLAVEPIVDVTKLGIAFFTTLGAMMMMRNRMKKLSKGQKDALS
jgi:uncharacterized spore protein YtfJ